MPEAFEPTVSEVKQFLVAGLVLGAGFTAGLGELTVLSGAKYAGISYLILFLREFGIRTIAHWMEADVEFHLSQEGSFTTIMGAFFGVVTSFPLMLLFPIYNTFSGERHEHWGKGIDAIWMKRKYWLASGGPLALMGGWLITYTMGLSELYLPIAVFLFFQMMPLDYSNIPTGTLDGAYILRWTGFTWLLLLGFTLIMMALSI